MLNKGITDMIRISDAHMSGTSYGIVITQTSSESAVGEPLAIVQNGDMGEVGVAACRLHLDVPEQEIVARLAAWSPNHDQPLSG